jgi:hypothetical protein
MSKVTTVQIQDTIVSIGEQLGFRAEKEFSFENEMPYTPRYDVVWLLDVSKLKINHLPGIQLIQKRWLPFAIFEIEGSTTSSKNQVGNLGNLLIGPSYYHFMVVDNGGAGNENDTYRRGMKIVRTMQELFGAKQLIFLDASMLLVLPNFTKTVITTEPGIVERLKGSGGETVSLPIAEKILSQLVRTNLTVRQDVVPDYFQIQFDTTKMKLLSKEYTYSPVTFEQKKIKSDKHYYYKPKIDVSAGFSISGGFVKFLHVIAERLKSDVVHFALLSYLQEKRINEIYYPLLGVEIESGHSKHAIGGLINASRFHQFGWIVGNEELLSAVETYQYYLGLRNTSFIATEDL